MTMHAWAVRCTVTLTAAACTLHVAHPPGKANGTGGMGGAGGTTPGGSASASGTRGGAGAGTSGTRSILIWPNKISSVNSDDWLVRHHTQIQELRPRFLVIDFANGYSLDQVKARWEKQKAWMQEASRYHGYSNPNAKPFLNYELAKLVDLTDPKPSDSPYPNSTKMPRRPKNNGYDIDFSQLFDQKYADYYGIKDPNNPSHNMIMCELFQHGTINDIFIAFNKIAPDNQVPEILEYKQEYDANDVKKPGQFDQYAGNGSFGPADIPAVAACGVSVRIGFLEMNGVLGNSLHVNAHNYEHIGKAVPHFYEMFKHFANLDMDTRYGLPFSSWYDECSYNNSACIDYPSENSVHFKYKGKDHTIRPFDQGCGNAHFPPNARHNYDETNTATVLTTCEHYGLHDGPGGKDLQTPYNVHTLDRWKAQYGVGGTGGAWFMYWFESWPGLNNKATMPDGTPMKNWWVYLYY